MNEKALSRAWDAFVATHVGGSDTKESLHIAITAYLQNAGGEFSVDLERLRRQVMSAQEANEAADTIEALVASDKRNQTIGDQWFSKCMETEARAEAAEAALTTIYSMFTVTHGVPGLHGSGAKLSNIYEIARAALNEGKDGEAEKGGTR